MHRSRAKKFISTMMNMRHIVKEVVGKLLDRFHIQSDKAKDLWHLKVKVGRKIVHTVCFMFNTIAISEKSLTLKLVLN